MLSWYAKAWHLRTDALWFTAGLTRSVGGNNTLLVQCWACRKDNENTELLGQVHVNRFVITGKTEKGTCPSS